MSKDIFGEDYFNRHRDNSQWEGLKNKSLANTLNLKYKPKRKLDEVMPPKKEILKSEPKLKEETYSKNYVKEEDIIDEEYKNHARSIGKWKSSFIQAILCGFCGGIIVLIMQKISLFQGTLFSIDGTYEVIKLLIITLIFIIIFALVYKALDNS